MTEQQVPDGYGIEERQSGFYAYEVGNPLPTYFNDQSGFAIRYPSYDDALAAVLAYQQQEEQDQL